MKNRITKLSAVENNPAGLSDRAFYLIALAFQLKKHIGPLTLQQFLTPEKFVVFNDELRRN